MGLPRGATSPRVFLNFFLEDKTSAPGPGCSKVRYRYPPDKSLSRG